MDRDDLVRHFDRLLKIRTLQFFDAGEESVQDMEREFALEALDLMSRQPAMAAHAGIAEGCGPSPHAAANRSN